MDDQLELSICIPCYNGGDKVVACVEHILSYKGIDIEVIVNDNASQDNSIARLKEIEDKRLRIFVNDKNIGPFRNWHAALSKGNGRYVMLLQDNDMLVVENLHDYLCFLRKVDYDIIKNAYNNREHISKSITAAQSQYFGKIFSHASYQAYKGDVIRKLKPLECSFDYNFCTYPYFIWDMQILQKHSVSRKRVYVNGNIEIVKLLEKDASSRTRPYVSNVPPSYTFENAVYMFDRYTEVLKKLYAEEKDFLKMYLYLYMGDLFVGTIWFYEHMNDPRAKMRYHMEINEDIDYLGLNYIFLKHAKDKLNMVDNLKRKVVYFKLNVITFKNRLLFKVEHVYERKFTNIQYFFGCLMNGILRVILNVIV